VVEVLIAEMFGSDRIRPKDYRPAVVIDARPKNETNQDTLQSEGRSALKNRSTEPTLLEMSGNATTRPLTHCGSGIADCNDASADDGTPLLNLS